MPEDSCVYTATQLLKFRFLSHLLPRSMLGAPQDSLNLFHVISSHSSSQQRCSFPQICPRNSLWRRKGIHTVHPSLSLSHIHRRSDIEDQKLLSCTDCNRGMYRELTEGNPFVYGEESSSSNNSQRAGKAGAGIPLFPMLVLTIP